MGDLEEFEININNGLDKIQHGLDGLNKKSHTAKKKAFQFLEGQFKHYRTLIESFDLEITQLDQSEQGQYIQQLKQINARFDKLKKEYEFKKNEGGSDLFDERNQINDTNQMTEMEMIAMGDKHQEEASNALDNIEKNVQEGIQLANEINCEIDKQIEKLDELYNVVKDTQSELKRTKKYLKYFAKNMYTDKIILALIFIIFCGIVALIILQAMGYNDGKSSSKDAVKHETHKTTPQTKEQAKKISSESTGRRFLGEVYQMGVETVVNYAFQQFEY